MLLTLAHLLHHDGEQQLLGHQILEQRILQNLICLGNREDLPRVVVSVLGELSYEIACLVSVRIEPLGKMSVIKSVFTKYRELFFQRQP